MQHTKSTFQCGIVHMGCIGSTQLHTGLEGKVRLGRMQVDGGGGGGGMQGGHCMRGATCVLAMAKGSLMGQCQDHMGRSYGKSMVNCNIDLGGGGARARARARGLENMQD